MTPGGRDVWVTECLFPGLPDGFEVPVLHPSELFCPEILFAAFRVPVVCMT